MEVGTYVGFRGASDGTSLGAEVVVYSVGAELGSTTILVGINVGASLGELDGISVGTVVGTSDGCSVGPEVGLCEVEKVGLVPSVGSLEGSRLGL